MRTYEQQKKDIKLLEKQNEKLLRKLDSIKRKLEQEVKSLKSKVKSCERKKQELEKITIKGYVRIQKLALELYKDFDKIEGEL